MENTYGLLVDLSQRLIEAGRRAGTIPEGPPAKVVAHALGFPGGRLTRATVGLDRLRLDGKVSGMSIALAVNFASTPRIRHAFRLVASASGTRSRSAGM